MSRTSASSLIAARTQAPRSIIQSAEMALSHLSADARISSGGLVQLARADVRGDRLIVRPERSDFPGFTLPNNTGAEGFAPGIFSHDYLVLNVAPPSLVGPAGLSLVGNALAADPTPGRDGPPSATGTRNNVGRLGWWNISDNFVRTYTIPSSDPRRSLTIVNYTIQGEHTMSEGFVLRFARLGAGNRIVLVTYGEGAAIKQSFLTSRIWRDEVKKVWTENANAIFAAAAGGPR